MAQQDLIFHIANKVQDVVWVSDRRFLALKELLVNIFTTFMWDMRVQFICPIQELECTFNTVDIDILCGQFVSVDSHVPVCEERASKHAQGTQ